MKASNVGGMIYAIGSGESGYVKIGSTKDLPRRLKALQTGHPARLSVLAHVSVEDQLVRIAKHIHGLLADYRTTGEWFMLPLDLEALEALIVRARQAMSEEDERRRQKAVQRRLATAEKHNGLRRLIGARILGLRLRLQMSQKAFGSAVGMTPDLLDWVEHGNGAGGMLRIEWVVTIANTFDCTADYLLGLTEDPTPPRRRRPRPAAAAAIAAGSQAGPAPQDRLHPRVRPSPCLYTSP